MPGIEARAPERTEALAGDAADLLERGGDLLLQGFRIGIAVVVVVGADLRGDGEAGRHRQAEIGHLSEPGALAAQEVAHVGAAFGLAVAEQIDPLAFGRSLARRSFRRRSFRLGLGGRLGRSTGRSRLARRWCLAGRRRPGRFRTSAAGCGFGHGRH
jgi:hypothetical protein